MENKQSNDNLKKILIASIILLLITNVTTLYLYMDTDDELVTTTEELVDTKSARDDLDQLLNEAKQQLGEFKGKNAKLDELIEQKNAELQAKAEQIEKLLRNKRITSAELKNALDELGKLRYYVEKYQKEIEKLSTENEYLKKQNKDINDSLDKAKEANEDLQMQNIKLGNKVSLGKKLTFSSMEIMAIHQGWPRREVSTNRARRVDLIKVAFTLEENFLADLGEKDFYLRIIGPEGSTLSSESNGGGMFKYQGSEYLYTMVHTLDFDNSRQSITFYYDRGTDWNEGKYTAELWVEGFKVAEEILDLR